MKKTLIVITCILVAILGVAGLAWYGFNYYYIPRFVVPQIQKQITIFNRDNKTNLKIQSIYYHPLRGFQLVGIELRPFLAAKEIDVDIDYLALLSRKIHLSQINIIEADLNVSRSTKGTWNFETAIKGAFNKGGEARPSFIVIDQINVSRGQVYFDDQLFKRNRLTKHFKDVTIQIKNPNREDYFVEASGADDKKRDAIQFKFNYSTKTGLIKGRAQLKIANVADYREYYIDEIAKPWQLGNAQIAIQAEFSYCKGDFSIDGNYAFKNGKINYGAIKLEGDGSIKHKQQYAKGKPKQSALSAQVTMDNLSLRFEKEVILEKVKCEAV
ncbi:MAG: AsmA family protein, partial [Candidatus Margulisiibacteriota bacterium]